MRIKFGADHKWTAGLFLGVILAGALASVIGRSALNALKQERVRQTQALLEKTTRDLVRFQSDCGFYPSTEQGLTALTVAPNSGSTCKDWRGPYGSEHATDAWGEPLHYTGDARKFSLASYGEDRAQGGEGFDQDLVFGGYE